MEAPIVRYQNVSGQKIGRKKADGSRSWTMSKGAMIEFRPDGDKLTDNQKTRQRERMREFDAREDIVRLPDRQPAKGEDETSPEE